MILLLLAASLSFSQTPECADADKAMSATRISASMKPTAREDMARLNLAAFDAEVLETPLKDELRAEMRRYLVDMIEIVQATIEFEKGEHFTLRELLMRLGPMTFSEAETLIVANRHNAYNLMRTKFAQIGDAEYLKRSSADKDLYERYRERVAMRACRTLHAK